MWVVVYMGLVVSNVARLTRHVANKVARLVR